MRALILAAAAVVCMSFAAPAQAGIAQTGMSGLKLNVGAETLVQEAQYRPRRHYRSHRYHRRHVRRHRHCWNQRVRVRVPGGHFVWRTSRRCGWR